MTKQSIELNGVRFRVVRQMRAELRYFCAWCGKPKKNDPDTRGLCTECEAYVEPAMMERGRKRGENVCVICCHHNAIISGHYCFQCAAGELAQDDPGYVHVSTKWFDTEAKRNAPRVERIVREPTSLETYCTTCKSFPCDGAFYCRAGTKRYFERARKARLQCEAV